MTLFYEYLNKKERDKWVRLLINCADWRCKWCLRFLQQLSEIFICKLFKYLFFILMLRFEWDILISSSYDGSEKCGYIMWCPSEGTSTLLKCVWLYLKVVQIQVTWTLWDSTFIKLHGVPWNCMKLIVLRKTQALYSLTGL